MLTYTHKFNPIHMLTAMAVKQLKSFDIINIYSPNVLNRLEYLTTSSPFSTAHIKEIEAYISADLFMPYQRTAGNLDTYLGTEVLVDGEFAVQVANVLTHWPRSGMTEDSYSTVAPYSGISHAIVIDDNAAANENLSQALTLVANTPYRMSCWKRSNAGTVNNTRISFVNFTDMLYDAGNGISYTDMNVTATYQQSIKHVKALTDITGTIYLSWTAIPDTGIYYIDLASLRPIVNCVFPNYTFNSAGSTTGDQFGSYAMALSDGGVVIYKGPLAGAAGINNIELTRTYTGLTIGKTYTVVYTAKSDGTGTGKVMVTNDLMLNGGFETAGGGGADVFASWTEAIEGTSTVNQDAAVFFSGAKSCRLDIDAENAAAYVYQDIAGILGQSYRVKLSNKVSASGKIAILEISTSTPNRFWNFATSVWQDGYTNKELASTVFQTVEAEIVAELNKNIRNLLGRKSAAAASASLWFDEVSFEHILGTSSIAATDTAETKNSFTFTATATSHKLILQSNTPNGKVTFKGVSVR